MTDVSKAALRRDALARRDALTNEQRILRSDSISARILWLSSEWPPGAVAGYWPMRSEVDLRPLLKSLTIRGRRILLPRIGKSGLTFHQFAFKDAFEPAPKRRRQSSRAKPAAAIDEAPDRISEEDRHGLVKASFGLSEPPPDAPEDIPAVMLVPLAAFDRRAHRIGYGAGYYDRAIAGLREQGIDLRLIGAAFATQETPRVPDEPHDRALDYIVTEHEVIDPRSA